MLPNHRKAWRNSTRFSNCQNFHLELLCWNLSMSCSNYKTKFSLAYGQLIHFWSHFYLKKKGGGTNTDNVKYEQTTRHHIDNFQEGRNSQGFTCTLLARCHCLEMAMNSSWALGQIHFFAGCNHIQGWSST